MLDILLFQCKEANEVALKRSRENEGLVEKLKQNLLNREHQIEVRMIGGLN